MIPLRKGKYLLSLLLVLLTVTIIAGCSSKTKVLSEKSFPNEYRNMSRVQFITGPQAIDSISKLHGTNITISKGYQVMYQGSEEQMVLWISESPTQEDATKLLAAMNTKIGNSQAFTNFQEKKIDGQEMYYVYGMNMDNYYYQKGTRIYWVAINAQDTSKEMSFVLKDF